VQHSCVHDEKYKKDFEKTTFAAGARLLHTRAAWGYDAGWTKNSQGTTLKKSTASVRAGSHREINMGGLNTPLQSSSAIEYLDDSEVRYPRYFNTLNHQVVGHTVWVARQW
jgi:hypothetical protein